MPRGFVQIPYVKTAWNTKRRETPTTPKPAIVEKFQILMCVLVSSDCLC